MMVIVGGYGGSVKGLGLKDWEGLFGFDEI